MIYRKQMLHTMKTSFLEYTKLILEKVSFNPSLFKKEFQKAQALLNRSERHELRLWAKKHRGPDGPKQ